MKKLRQLHLHFPNKWATAKERKWSTFQGHGGKKTSSKSVFASDSGWQEPDATLFCYLKFFLLLRFIWFPQIKLSLSGRTKSKWGFYFSECLRGNYIKPNRNHIGAWDDKWRPWITALLLLYLDMGEKLILPHCIVSLFTETAASGGYTSSIFYSPFH